MEGIETGKRTGTERVGTKERWRAEGTGRARMVGRQKMERTGDGDVDGENGRDEGGEEEGDEDGEEDEDKDGEGGGGDEDGDRR